MEKCIITCPHCHQNLEIEVQCSGMTVLCPVCGRNFIASHAHRIEQEENSSDISHKKKEYFYGRLYISIARIVAIVIVLLTICAVVLCVIGPFASRKRAIDELKKNSIPDIVKEQNKFYGNYINFAQLILTANNAETEFKFPEKISYVDGAFNNELITEQACVQSIKTLELYKSKIRDVSSIMLETFKKNTDKINQLLAGGNSITFTFSSRPKNKNQAMRLNLTVGQNVNFYKINLDEALRNLFFYLEKLNEIRNINSKLAYGTEIGNIKRDADFINKTLNNKRENFVVEGRRNNNEEHRQEKHIIGNEQYVLEKECLRMILHYINILSDSENWQISTEAEELEYLLKKHQRKLNEIIVETEANIREALIYAGLIFLSGIFSAFLIMVFADYLAAHFDSATALRSLDRKIKIFLFLPLACLLLISGCSKSPEETLKKSVEHLRKSAVMAVFAEQISQNYGSVIYGIPEKKLIFITGGNKSCSIMEYDDLKIASISPCFNVAILSCTSSAAVGSICKNKTGDYSHEATLTLNISYEICYTDTKHKDGTPGVAFHFLLPDNFSTQGNDYVQWLQNRFNQLPPYMPDHAAAISAVEKLEKIRRSEVKVFKVLFNSKTQKWELKDAPRSVEIEQIPPTYMAADINLNGTKFKKLSVNISGEESILFIDKYDYEIIGKRINQGLIKHNGSWKKKSVVEQTLKLQKAIDWWNNEKDSRGVSLDDLKKILKIIKECSEAENYAAVIEMIEKAVVNVFIAGKKETVIKKRDHLIYLLNFFERDQHITILNRQNLVERCKDRINEIDKNLRNLKGEVTGLKQSINSVIERGEYNNLSAIFDRLEIYGKAELRELFPSDIIRLVKIYNNDEFEVIKLRTNDGRLGEYNLMHPCRLCGGSGKKRCSYCNSSGTCHKCGGAGSRYVTKIRLVNQRFEEYSEREACTRQCYWCKGQTVKCDGCNGNAKFVNKKRVKKALDIELKLFKNELTKVENYLNSIINTK